MEPTLRTINAVISALFFICYTYQFLYIPLVLLKKRRPLPRPAASHRYAVLIAARNEENVIAGLLDSLAAQTYDMSLVTVFVAADNCTDSTAAIARAHGAVVYERFNHVNVGKGYALDFLLQHIGADYPEGFDGYFVFDADNILSPDYLERMNESFSAGNEIVTSYRNSKNFGDNWISAGYALWFLRESRYLNGARNRLGSSAAVGGTGFLFSQRILDESHGWRFYLLTEDIEFSIHHILRGEKIAICEDAVLYDEQPTSFRQSVRQRLRWAKGYIQVFRRYGAELLKGTAKGSWSCFDMSMSILPAFILTALGPAGQPDAVGAGPAAGRRRVVRHAVPSGVHVQHPGHAAGAGRHHRGQRVAAHPRTGVEKDRFHSDVPAVYADVSAHLAGGAVYEGGVEAHPPQREPDVAPLPRCEELTLCKGGNRGMIDVLLPQEVPLCTRFWSLMMKRILSPRWRSISRPRATGCCPPATGKRPWPRRRGRTCTSF